MKIPCLLRILVAASAEQGRQAGLRFMAQKYTSENIFSSGMPLSLKI
jgi:hypothetical protein